MLAALIPILLFYAASNALIAFRLHAFFCALFHLKRAPLFLAIYAIAALTVPLRFVRRRLPFDRALDTAAAYWMGVYVYLLLFCLLFELLFFVLRLTGATAALTSAKIALLRGGLTLLCAAAVCVYGFLHVNDLRTVRYEVNACAAQSGASGSASGTATVAAGSENGAMPGDSADDSAGRSETGTDALRIALVSDLHIGAEGAVGRLASAVRIINEEQPDVVLIAGDTFDGDFGAVTDTETVAALFGSLSPALGAFACPGNHDAGETSGKMFAFLESCGVTVLREEARTVGGRLTVAGRSDGRTIGTASGKKRGSFSDIAFDRENGLPVVVLDHNPAHIGEYGPDVTLVVCGHTHKGQLFPGSLITRAMYEIDYGLLPADGTRPACVVTSGAGVWGPPMRVGTDSEVVFITLNA